MHTSLHDTLIRRVVVVYEAAMYYKTLVYPLGISILPFTHIVACYGLAIEHTFEIRE